MGHSRAPARTQAAQSAWVGLAAGGLGCQLDRRLFWQGPHYSLLSHSISDMYAVTAPAGLVPRGRGQSVPPCHRPVRLAVGVAVVADGRRVGGRWVGVLLGLSIYGLHDPLTPFERLARCIADEGCSASDQFVNSGGWLDVVLSIAGIERVPCGASSLQNSTAIL